MISYSHNINDGNPNGSLILDEMVFRVRRIAGKKRAFLSGQGLACVIAVFYMRVLTLTMG